MNKDNLLNLFNSTVDKLVKTNRQFSRKKKQQLKKGNNAGQNAVPQR